MTDQFIDLEARLTNLEALEVELRALLAEVRQQRDADPDKLLRVYNEIAGVRGVRSSRFRDSSTISKTSSTWPL